MFGLDEWLKRTLLYGPDPTQPTDAFSQSALAAQGGIDPRLWESGTPDFSTGSAQAGLLGAKALGAVTDPGKLSGLLGLGALAFGGGGRGMEAPTFRGHRPTEQGPGIQAIAASYQPNPRRRKKLYPGDDPWSYLPTPFDGGY